ncbi:AAA family ATPase [Krasilnikovia sp. M28-CT-15]|uniref:bifunctional aminoglycoside phosphotransferase/ATP-binding protein n=1 Tax=Krasilnikovia sp. M28-CT-15 TaxID=3373540 RepID=UPI0038761AEF
MRSTAPGTAFATAVETHAAVVYVAGDLAFKLKKPVDLGFLDFRDRTTREAVCHREVELNRRLAPDVYLGVADVHGPDGNVCDHLVVMRRMPADRRLTTLLAAGTPVDGEVRRLARMLASFHARARHGPEIDAEGRRDALRGRWDATFAQLRPFHGAVLPELTARTIERLTHDFLAGRGRLFADRVAAGRIVDGHADLLADDIFCLDDGPRILDCIEFDDRLRYVDGLDDAAFLAMDLERLGAPRLGAAFLDWYAEFAADPAPASLRHHYIAYRAYVRAKVACLRHAQGDPAAAAGVTVHADLALRHLRAGVVRLVLVGGAPGTGKSTLAGRLADRLGAVVLNSDRIRKALAGVAGEQSAAAPYREGIYAARWTRRTYDELFRRAARLLDRGETVLLDASFTDAGQRAAARDLATATHSTLTELRCTATPAAVRQRMADRVGDPHEASDADARIAAALAAEADPWPQARTVPADTTPDAALTTALAALDESGQLVLV